MSEHNGLEKSPTRVVARNVAELAHDAVTISELQAELLKTELEEMLRAAVTPIALLVISLAVLLGCIPVLLFALAYSLTEFAGISQGWSMLIAAFVGLGVAGSCTFIALRKLQNNSLSFERSRVEFRRNINWLKHVLKVISNVGGGHARAMASNIRSHEATTE